MANFKQIIAMCLDGASYAQITHALGCSRREVSRAKKVISDEGLISEIFRQLPSGWFDDRFSDGRSKRSLSYDLLYLGGACRCQRLGVLSRVIFSPLRSAWSMWILSGNQDEAADPAKETNGAYRCQMVPNGATLVLLPPVTTGSEEDPGTPAGRLDSGSSPASRGNPGWDG